MSVVASGGFTLNCTLSFQIVAGGNTLTTYDLPVQPFNQCVYTSGTGPNQINKGAQLGGSLVATTLTIDLSTIACVDGSTGFSHIREFAVYNDDTNDAHVLKLDLTIANSFSGFIEGTLTDIKLDIPAGGVFRFPKPIGTNGWVRDGTHKIVTLDSGANTIPYRFVCGGD